ncbi:alpha/beta-hydrolase [Mytilinidion resinicola]|uniref:Alpha/beta-hydrolase n=1 Tax=Mytilinidion resinicola TaxID=574789 RepID=A0A6A6YSI6_9PEZI|nr:alpha/beta-hydrolase [Mytilinidion resinicola]KAF2811892.1 alpha/beta-hydrolase [Mytilinidion resinicola]
MEIQDQFMTHNGLRKSHVNNPAVCTYSRGLEHISATNPALVLLHGYPQSAYIWRHMIPLLPKSAPLFIPDLPGYGNSEAPTAHDKLSVGLAVLSALHSVLKEQSENSSKDDTIPVMLIGHDRGARIAHRLGVSGAPDIRILGVTLIDIVPTSTQWAGAGNPHENAGFFHWPFLANVELATKMITAYGGDKFCVDMIGRWVGNTPKGLARMKEGDSYKVYADSFLRESVIRATCQDYEAGAGVDVDVQKEDQKAGRKLQVPVLLIYGAEHIGRRFDVKKEWIDWVGEGVKITDRGLGDGIGHFAAEEAPEETTEAILSWQKSLLKSS